MVSDGEDEKTACARHREEETRFVYSLSSAVDDEKKCCVVKKGMINFRNALCRNVCWIQFNIGINAENANQSSGLDAE